MGVSETASSRLNTDDFVSELFGDFVGGVSRTIVDGIVRNSVRGATLGIKVGVEVGEIDGAEKGDSLGLSVGLLIGIIVGASVNATAGGEDTLTLLESQLYPSLLATTKLPFLFCRSSKGNNTNYGKKQKAESIAIMMKSDEALCWEGYLAARYQEGRCTRLRKW